MRYKDFENALDNLNIVTRLTKKELRVQYRKLSKRYHPDMPTGDEKKFIKINESYNIVLTYMNNFRFSLDEEEFHRQNPSSSISDEWFKTFNC